METIIIQSKYENNIKKQKRLVLSWDKKKEKQAIHTDDH